MKRKVGRRCVNYALGIMNCALLSSCQTDDLCFNHPHGASISVEFDWSNSPDFKADGMRVWLYPQDIEKFETQLRDIAGTKGGVVTNILEGRYHIISHNNDSELIYFQDRESHGSHLATTRDADILEPMSRSGEVSSGGLRSEDDERVALPPDKLWLANINDVEIADNSTITLAPRQMHCHYTYEFLNVGNTANISKVSASISGMSAGIMLSNGSHTGQVCTHPLETHIDEENGRLYGDFYTFGYPEVSEAPHIMGLYVVLIDGQKIKFTEGDYLNVTSQVRNASDPLNVHIVIDGIELPKPLHTGGFDPTVSDWVEEDHDIDI